MAAPQLKSAPTSVSHDEAHDDHDDLMAGPHKKGEEGEGPWLVSYADLMTLLMGFFALISSFSSVNQEKFEKVKESASESFGGTYEMPYAGLSESLKAFLKENGLEGQVQIITGADGVQLIFSGTMFFDSGDFHVKSDASELMKKLATKIKEEPQEYKTLIEGHTDSVPISHPIIASNWELSGLRASRIAQIFEFNGFKKEHLTIIGWGETKPAYLEETPDGLPIVENRAKNRRVVLKIYDSKVSPDPVQSK